MRALIKPYLRERSREIAFVLGILAIFGLVQSLYGLPREPWLYASALVLVMGGLCFICQFVIYVKTHEDRRRILNAPELAVHNLPAPTTLLESDYRAMVEALANRCRELNTTYTNQRQESLDYYTTWVHQIKTPISVLQMYLQSEDTREHREMSAELFRIEQYVEMVLSYIRLGSNDTDWVLHSVDLNSLLRQCIRKYSSLFIRNHIRLIYEETDATVLSDEKWLAFLIEQILSNAIKYTALTGSGTITISVSPSKVLTIRDTGIGIAPEDLPRIFEKGFTGYNGRADRKSTGLGLYLCRQTADKLGIRLWAESELGVGTSVMLDLASRELEVE